MSAFSGFCELRVPRDLLQKLQHDIGRLAADPGNTYAAFDFFVTAEHMVDWIYPTCKTDRKALRAEPLLAVTSHIANGAKHFSATHIHHTSVRAIEKERYVRSGYVEEGYAEQNICIKLSSSEAAAFGYSEIAALDLARRVLAYWEARIHESSQGRRER